MPIKLIVMDMDGTVLDDDHATIPQRNIDALRAASAAGAKLALASGRTWSLMADAQEQLGVLDYALLSNGAAIRDLAAGKSIYENAIPNAQALDIAQALLREGLAFEIYCDGCSYVRATDREQVLELGFGPAFYEHFDRQTVFYSGPPAEVLQGRDAEKINIFYVPEERWESVRREIETLGPVAFTHAMRTNMEFNAVGINKGAALRVLAEHLGISADEVMAFGDADNDLEMLSWAGWSFAMGNATDEAKATAKGVTGRNSEAGVAMAVEKYVLGR